MQNFQWYDGLRLLNVLILFASLSLLWKRANLMWDEYTRRFKDLVICLTAILLLMIEGAVEQIVADVSWGPRTILTTCVSLFTLRAMAHEGGYTKE